MSRLQRKLWLEPPPGARWSPSAYWHYEAGLRLWTASGTRGSHHSRGCFSVGEAVLAPSAQDAEEGCDEPCHVVTLQLHLAARHFRGLAGAGQTCDPVLLFMFASMVRYAADRTLREAPFVPALDSVLFRLRVHHVCAEVSDEERSAMQSMFWNFPDLMESVNALQYFEDTWSLVGPASTARIGWGMHPDFRCPPLARDC